MEEPMKTRCYVILTILCALFCSLGCDAYAKLWNRQGYKLLVPPRNAFGTGTIIRGDDASDIMAGPDDCFPSLDSSIKTYDQKLMDSKEYRGWSFNLGAKYTPTSLANVEAAFSFKSVQKVDVSFGEAKGNLLTPAAFENYLDGQTLTAGCLRRLTDPRSRLILNVAQVMSMEYTFHGEKEVGGSTDAAALDKILKANGVASYKITSDRSFKIEQPMFVAYRAVKFKDLGITVPRKAQGDASVVLRRGQFKLTYD
jgi:hypothetical protein